MRRRRRGRVRVDVDIRQVDGHWATIVLAEPGHGVRLNVNLVTWPWSAWRHRSVWSRRMRWGSGEFGSILLVHVKPGNGVDKVKKPARVPRKCFGKRPSSCVLRVGAELIAR